MAAFLHRAENRGGWEQIEGESADGDYIEFRASEDQTEVPWRPKGLALTVRCTDNLAAEEPDLQVSAFGYGSPLLVLRRFRGDRVPLRRRTAL